MSGPAVWHPASEPPTGQDGKYSRRVVVMSEQWRLYSISYYHPSQYERHDMGLAGCWQTPAAMVTTRDKPAFWCEEPKP